MTNSKPLTGLTGPLDESALHERYSLPADEWEVRKTTVSERAGVFQQWATFRRRQPDIQWPVVQGVLVEKMHIDRAGKYHADLDRVLVVPDMHVGYRRESDGTMTPLHDEGACEIVAEIIRDLCPRQVVMVGDNLDLAEWSSKYIVSPDLAQTTQAALEYLASWIVSWRECVDIVFYLEGNHEKRMVDAVTTNLRAACGLHRAGDKSQTPVLSVPHLLDLDGMDVTWVGDYPRGTVWLNDNLRCTHAQALSRRSGMSAANTLDGATCSSIFGHAHRLEMAHVTTHRRNKRVPYGAYCVGTLAHLDGRVPSNTSEENWQQGFALVDLYDDNYFHVNLVPIVNNRCFLHGKEYYYE